MYAVERNKDMILQYLKWYIFHENTESLFCNPKHIEYCLSNEKERVDGWLKTQGIIKNEGSQNKNEKFRNRNSHQEINLDGITQNLHWFFH